MSLTTANSQIILTVAGLFSTGQPLQGFSADDIFDIGDITNAETSMGVDGNLSYGFTPVPTDQTIYLQSDSPSAVFFDTVIAAEKIAKDKLRFDGTIVLLGLGQAYRMINGVLLTFTPISAAKKIAQPRKFLIRWQDYNQSPV